jgi:hypothetical protein
VLDAHLAQLNRSIHGDVTSNIKTEFPSVQPPSPHKGPVGPDRALDESNADTERSFIHQERALAVTESRTPNTRFVAAQHAMSAR